MRLPALAAAMIAALTLPSCASLEALRAIVQPPRFSQAEDRPSEIRLLPIQAGRPAGGATVRIWTTVTNPNAFGFTLNTVDASLLLEDARAAQAEFPLGLPLTAGETSTIPFDLTVSFADVPRLAGVLRAAASGQEIDYELEGTIGVDAGRFGRPTFGPMTLISGELRASRTF